jgi:predicted ATP-dependent Lon-type protease
MGIWHIKQWIQAIKSILQIKWYSLQQSETSKSTLEQTGIYCHIYNSETCLWDE